MENKLKFYLLQSLSDEKTEEIDLQVISGSVPEEELIAAEDDLMEDFLDGTLSPLEIELFYKNFLVSDERKSTLKLLSQLKNHMGENAQIEPTSKPQIITTDNFFDKLKRFINLNYRPATAVFTAIVLGLMVGTYLYYAGGNQVAELNKRDLRNLSEYENLSSISLTPGAFRNEEERKNLTAANSTERVLLRLTLPIEISSKNIFNVKIIKEQDAVSTLKQIPSYQDRGAQELRLILPSSLLTKGDYKIEVTPENAGNLLIVYTFAVK